MEAFFNNVLMGALGIKLAESFPTNIILMIGLGGIFLGVLLSMMFPKLWRAVK